MATRTGILNTSGQFIMLPPPYAGGLPAGAQAIVSDTPAVVIAALGGAAFIAKNLLVQTLSGSATATTHNNGLGQPACLSTKGSNGAGAVTFTGAAVGDTVLTVGNVTLGTDVTSSFESTITVVNQIQQSAATDLSSTNIFIVLMTKG